MPLIEYRRQTVSVDAGEQTVLFEDTFIEGDALAFSQATLSGYTADGDVWHVVPYDLDYLGFKVNFPEAVTLNYDVSVKI